MIFPKVPTGGATFLFMYANNDTMSTIGVVWTGGGWFVHDSVTGDQTQIDPRTDAWNHVALDVTFAQSGGAGMIEFDYVDSNGAKQAAKLSKSTLGTTTATVTSINCGAGIAPFSGVFAPMKMTMDDVVFEPF